MATDEGFTTFSIRIPVEMAQQLAARAKLSKRSRNSEIQFLLEAAIDGMIAQDKLLLEEMRLRNHPQAQASGT